MHDTWYVLENGQPANPDECAPDASGRLVHKSGVPVAMRGDVPRSRGMSADEIAALGSNRELKAAPAAKGYRTRAAKAE